MNTQSRIDLLPIKALLDKHFAVPSYQRGYRWTDYQVIALLDDLWQFAKRPEKKETDIYCLQPVVVQQADGSWMLIDGQQRLTTIYIILSYINTHILKADERLFRLTFDTRPNSETFLQNIDESKKEENIDYYHICWALETVRNWFEKLGNTNLTVMQLYPVLLEHTHIIWYELGTSEDPITVFTRINNGKIPLTDAELIKALLLRSTNFELSNDLRRKHHKQIEIATEWDKIEISLHNQDFWYFLTDGETHYASRIQLIFELIADEKNSRWVTEDRIEKRGNDFYCFMVFNKWFENNHQAKLSSAVEEIWNVVKEYFMTFEEWYEDKELFHLIGFLVTTGEKLQYLKRQSEKATKTDFIHHLQTRIKNQLNCQITQVEYPKDKHQIRKLLLFFNIATLLRDQNIDVRFPFKRYKIEKWDIEHIHAIASDVPSSRKHREDWLTLVLNEIDQKSMRERISDLLNDPTDTAAFESLYHDILKLFSENGVIEEIHNISNLTLLDAQTNRSYKNAVFPVKRKKIIEKDEDGQFIPICTKNVFLKYYNKDTNQMSFWSNDDRQAYLAKMNEVLTNYLPN